MHGEVSICSCFQILGKPVNNYARSLQEKEEEIRKEDDDFMYVDKVGLMLLIYGNRFHLVPPHTSHDGMLCIFIATKRPS